MSWICPLRGSCTFGSFLRFMFLFLSPLWKTFPGVRAVINPRPLLLLLFLTADACIQRKIPTFPKRSTRLAAGYGR